MTRLWLIFSLLFPALALGQTTAVTATTTDGAGQIWANGTYTINFVPTPGLPNNYQWQGTKFVAQQYHGTMDGSGTFSVTLPDNFTITPAGTQWAFILCPNATAQCTTITTPVTGASEDLSALFSSRVLAPTIFATPMPRAYSSSEVAIPPPLQGGQFYSVTDNVPYFWTGTEWKALGGTVQSFSAGNLSPLFTTSVANPGTEPALSFALSNAAADTVFGNCTGSSASPTYCALTAAMIPSLPYVPSGTMFYYQTVDLNGTAQTQRSALNFSSFFAITDSSSPSRTTIDAAQPGANKTCAYPTTMTVDAYGRTTSCTSGTAPASSYAQGVTITTACSGGGTSNCICSPPSSSTYDECFVNIDFPAAFPNTVDAATANCQDTPVTSGPSTNGSALCSVYEQNASGVQVIIQNLRSQTANPAILTITAVGH